MHLKRPPIIHRDIKPLNIPVSYIEFHNIIENESTYSFIRWHLILPVFCMWFGYSQDDYKMQTIITSMGDGTPSYITPEIYHAAFRGTSIDY